MKIFLREDCWVKGPNTCKDLPLPKPSVRLGAKVTVKGQSKWWPFSPSNFLPLTQVAMLLRNSCIKTTTLPDRDDFSKM